MKIKGIYKVVYIGPFYTGFFINTASLINKGYVSVQKRIIDDLGRNQKEGWFIEGSSKEDVLWDIEFKSVYGGTPKIPASFIGKTVSPTSNIIEVDKAIFRIKRAKLYYYDYGVGTFRLVVNVELTEEMEVREYREIAEQFSPKIGEILNPLLETDTLDLEASLNRLSIPIDSYKEFSQAVQAKGMPHLTFNSCLWYHRAFLFEMDRNTPITEDDYNKYKDVLFSSQMKGPQNCSLNEYAQVYPSFNFSLYIYDKARRPADIRLNRILELAEYYYAATSLLDTILFHEFTRFTDIREKTPKIKELKQELDSLKNLAEQLDLFMLLLKDSIVNFSPSSVIMWRNLDNEWYYTPLLESLKEKSILLDEKVSEKLEILTQKRAETMNRLLKIFTVFAILGPILELYSILNELNIMDVIINNIGLISIIGVSIIAVIFLIVYLNYKKGLVGS